MEQGAATQLGLFPQARRGGILVNPRKPKDMEFARYRYLITENKARKGGQVYGLRQQGLSYKRREDILVSDKTMEFLKDRLDKQIRELTRENGHLRDTVFRKDCELNAVRLQLADADKTHTFLSVVLGIVLLAFLVFSLYAVRLIGE